MAPPPDDDDHACGWKVFAKDLVEKMAELEAKMAAMERRVLGPKSEKLPQMDREVRKQRPADPAATQEKRRLEGANTTQLARAAGPRRAAPGAQHGASAEDGQSAFGRTVRPSGPLV